MTLSELKEQWVDTPEFHKDVHELFCSLVNSDKQLKAHRDYVEQNIWGFGERSFHWMWKLLLSDIAYSEIKSELQYIPKILEIGCFRGQTLSLFKILRPDIQVYGISPLSTEGGMWDSNYWDDICKIHDDFLLEHPFIIPALSESEGAILTAQCFAPYDVVYIDGGHERHHIDNDLLYYAPMVKNGGYLVVDDACCDMNMPWGYFQGIQPVTDGVLAYMSENGSNWEFIGNVVHLRVYKRI